MNNLRENWDWALDFVGDPLSWSKRGELITEFLREEGMTQNSHVLDIGCGNLSTGVPLIRWLAGGRYVGLEPFGLLVNLALERHPDLAAQAPRFVWRTDFDASEVGRKFDYLVAHSVVSHMAWWQLEQMFANTRKVVDEGAVMLASFRNDQYGSWSEDWRYPSNTTFRLQTLVVCGDHTGWRVEIDHSLGVRLSTDCPNDVHDWVKCTAVLSTAEINARRLAEEEQAREEQAALQEAEDERVAALASVDADGEMNERVIP